MTGDDKEQRSGSDEELYTPMQLWEAVRQLGLRTPAEARKMIREDRDARN